MPLVGQDRKAKPLYVWEAFNEVYGTAFSRVCPRPKPSESFNDYFQRIGWEEDALFKAMIGVGCTTDKSSVNQRDYLLTLESMADELYRIRGALFRMWPK